MANGHTGAEASALYGRIREFVDSYHELKKKWDTASKLPNLQLPTAFQETCNLAALVGTSDPIENRALYMAQRKEVSKLVEGQPNKYEPILKLFHEHVQLVVKAFDVCKNENTTAHTTIGKCGEEAAAKEAVVLQLSSDITKLLEKLQTEESEQEKQLKEYLNPSGNSTNKSYDSVKKDKEDADRDVKNTIAKLAEEEKTSKEYKEYRDNVDQDFSDPEGGDYYWSTMSVWQTKLEAIEKDIEIDEIKLQSLRNRASDQAKALKAMEDTKTERENAITALKSSESRLKEIKPELDQIKLGSAALRTTLIDDLAVFTTCESHIGVVVNRAHALQNAEFERFLPSRAMLSEKVVAIVNEGSYFGDRANVLPLLRKILAEVEKANKWGVEETEVLRLNLNSVSQLLTAYTAEIAAGKRGKELPAPVRLKVD